jgi:putative GTP pyrophosphokinase
MKMIEGMITKYNSTFEQMQERRLVDTMCFRMKTAESVAYKLERRGLEISYRNAVQYLNDLAGIRIVCSFCDDVYRVEKFLTERPELMIVKEKDYIKQPKASGYQSVHLIADMEYPFGTGGETVRVEIQICTAAMNYWAKLDHQLCYKCEKRGKGETAGIRRELCEYAQEIADIDKKMLALRKKIEAVV